MKLFYRLTLSLLGLSIVTGSALANKYPSDTSPYSTSYVYQEQPYDPSLAQPFIPKVQNFTGFYLGVGITETFFKYDVSANPQGGDFSKNSPGVSIFWGYGYEFVSGIYLGGQLSGIYYPFSQLDDNSFGYPGTTGTYYSSGIAPLFSINLDFTPGYEIIKHLLVYGLVGVGFDVYRYNYTYTTGGSTTDIIDDSTDVSVALRLGGGLKYQFTKNWMVNLDYVFSQGSPIKDSGWQGSTNLSQSFKPTNQTIELGIAYKF